MFLSGLPALTIAGPAIAAVPTYDEYLGGQGAVARTGAAPKSLSKQQLGPGGPVSITSVEDLRLALISADQALDPASDFITKQDWDALLALVKKSPAVAFILKPNFGAPAKVLADLPNIEDQWEDVSQTLGELRDFAFENRVVFFNGADRSEVEKLAEETGYVSKFDLTEPRALLAAVRSKLRKVAREI